MAKILIVDDEETDRVGLGAILEQAGHDVALAEGGDEALDRYVSSRIHLVITDIVMPGRDGLSLILALKTVDHDAAIIAISGKSPGQLEASKTYGADRILAKPIDPLVLLSTVDEVLAGRGESA